MALALRDQRRLKVDVRRRAPIVEGSASSGHVRHPRARPAVALSSKAARPPAEDVRPVAVGGQAEPRPGSAPRRRADRGRDARELVSADTEPEENRRDRGPRISGPRRATRASWRHHSAWGPRRPPFGPRPRPRPRAARIGPRSSLGRRGGLELVGQVASAWRCPSMSASARARTASTAAALVRGDPRRAETTGRRPGAAASHLTVSVVGRVLPRSIWLTYSLENRSQSEL